MFLKTFDSIRALVVLTWSFAAWTTSECCLSLLSPSVRFHVVFQVVQELHIHPCRPPDFLYVGMHHFWSWKRWSLNINQFSCSPLSSRAFPGHSFPPLAFQEFLKLIKKPVVAATVQLSACTTWSLLWALSTQNDRNQSLLKSCAQHSLSLGALCTQQGHGENRPSKKAWSTESNYMGEIKKFCW